MGSQIPEKCPRRDVLASGTEGMFGTFEKGASGTSQAPSFRKCSKEIYVFPQTNGTQFSSSRGDAVTFEKGGRLGLIQTPLLEIVLTVV